jgi:hypothetical protein
MISVLNQCISNPNCPTTRTGAAWSDRPSWHSCAGGPDFQTAKIQAPSENSKQKASASISKANINTHYQAQTVRECLVHRTSLAPGVGEWGVPGIRGDVLFAAFPNDDEH